MNMQTLHIKLLNHHVVFREVWVMTGCWSKGLCENLCARRHWMSRRQSLETALRRKKEESCTFPVVKLWRRKTVRKSRRRRRRRRGSSSHVQHIGSENVRTLKYLMCHNNNSHLSLFSQRHTFKSIAVLVGRISLLSMSQSQEYVLSSGHTWEFS